MNTVVEIFGESDDEDVFADSDEEDNQINIVNQSEKQTSDNKAKDTNTKPINNNIHES